MPAKPSKSNRQVPKKQITLLEKIPKQMVKVVWYDAQHHDKVSISQALQQELTLTETFGYLLVHNKRKTTICWNYQVDDPISEDNDIQIISTKMIKEIVYLDVQR